MSIRHNNIVIYEKRPSLRSNKSPKDDRESISTARTIFHKESLSKVLMTKEKCRFCLDYTYNENNPMISPCKCKGTFINVHEACLKKWIIEKQTDTKPKCEWCQFEFLHRFEESRKISLRKICNSIWIILLIILLGLVIVIGVYVMVFFIIDCNCALPVYIIGGVGLVAIAGVIAFRLRNCEENWFEVVFKSWRIINMNDKEGLALLKRRTDIEEKLNKGSKDAKIKISGIGSMNMPLAVAVPISIINIHGSDFKMYSQYKRQYPFLMNLYIVKV